MGRDPSWAAHCKICSTSKYERSSIEECCVTVVSHSPLHRLHVSAKENKKDKQNQLRWSTPHQKPHGKGEEVVKVPWLKKCSQQNPWLTMCHRSGLKAPADARMPRRCRLFHTPLDGKQDGIRTWPSASARTRVVSLPRHAREQRDKLRSPGLASNQGNHRCSALHFAHKCCERT